MKLKNAINGKNIGIVYVLEPDLGKGTVMSVDDPLFDDLDFEATGCTLGTLSFNPKEYPQLEKYDINNTYDDLRVFGIFVLSDWADINEKIIFLDCSKFRVYIPNRRGKGPGCLDGRIKPIIRIFRITGTQLNAEDA